jgi:Transposase, Mutator family
LGAQLLMQAVLEAEVTEFLGRDRYQRAAACEDARPGSRNGYRAVTVTTTVGRWRPGASPPAATPAFIGLALASPPTPGTPYSPA